MKKEIIFYLVILMVPMLLNAKIVGYHDRDKNHINDLFKDANRDGINDITGKDTNIDFLSLIKIKMV